MPTDPTAATRSRARYVLCPGWITSQNDGDRHYIGAAQLARLYGVNLRDCLVKPAQEKLHPTDCVGRVFLHPRFDGDYRLPALSDA
jgi:hypothetical protein